MQTLSLWIAVSFAAGTLVTLLVIAAMRGRKPVAPKLPTEWPLSARPVFNANERRAYRQLRDAFPQHIVLSKLPLVRMCQPNDPEEVRYWYDLLGATHVTFAVCSANGRVLAAIDLDVDRKPSRRSQSIKQSVLGACRIRYFRCPIDPLPSVAELQLLVPAGSVPVRLGQPGPAIDRARDELATTVATKRRERGALWSDSSFIHDSFFAPDNRTDFSLPSEFDTGHVAPAAAPPLFPPSRAPRGDGARRFLGEWTVDEAEFRPTLPADEAPQRRAARR